MLFNISLLWSSEIAVITMFYKYFTPNGVKKNRPVETKCY